jgi:hypothetical protein
VGCATCDVLTSFALPTFLTSRARYSSTSSCSFDECCALNRLLGPPPSAHAAAIACGRARKRPGLAEGLTGSSVRP